ncbi:MAG: ferredoxin [Acidimicrobiia bacterium]
MHVTVTEDCAGTGQCVLVAPAVFGLDDDGLSTVIGPVDTLESAASARLAADRCPMGAIRIEE